MMERGMLDDGAGDAGWRNRGCRMAAWQRALSLRVDIIEDLHRGITLV